MKKKISPALGKGLGALLGEGAGTSSISDVALNAIKPNPEQPRRDFNDQTLEELASSIKSIGIVQPITLREVEDGTYMIISGERRWRAASLAGLTRIPAYIRTVSDDEMMEMALIENVQREDLNAIEIALAYRRLLDTTGVSQEELSSRVGKSRATISNQLRLLNLPAEIQLGLTKGLIDMGHARTLLSLPKVEDRLKVYNEILEKGLSVRDVERRCKEIAAKETPAKTSNDGSKKRDDFNILGEQLTHFFSAPVTLKVDRMGKGHLTISFKDEQQLMNIIAKIEDSRLDR